MQGLNAAYNENHGDKHGWQLLAGATDNIAAPANAVTAVGTWLTLDGIDHAGTYLGAFEQITGRGFDMVDGWVARGTGTASPLVEAFDAGTDAGEVLYAGTKRLTYEMLTAPEAGWFVGQKIINIAATGMAVARGREIHPSKTGKHTSAALSVTYFGRSLARALESNNRYTGATRAHTLARIATRASVVLGIPASLGYLADAGVIKGKPADVINKVNDTYEAAVNSLKKFVLGGIRSKIHDPATVEPIKPGIYVLDNGDLGGLN